ncbi:hypothetical protein Ddye_016039 [Dipteronia dyeriana]|uniref:Uncharacterized protein n=1 Tax=Dipteronia dyeriana TaxID=168575 RepID=A0AAD9U6T6_9ROSI|nr:hypothetical protein Ddye_016039 [Dipteronia dyeriana]
MPSQNKKMLLRSSSTPVLGSLLPSSFSDSPNNNNNIHHEITSTAAKHHHLPPTKRSFGSSLNFPPVSCNPSPIADLSDTNKGFRRAQSDGNLEGLAYASCNKTEDFNNKSHPNKFSARNKCLMLQTIPSFSYSNRSGRRQEEDDSDIEEEERKYFEENERARERVMAVQGGQFWNGCADGESREMYLARGLGIGGGDGGGGGGGEFNPAGSGGDDNGDNHGVEEHYKKMVLENPGNPLFLRNYAQFLYQSKQDLHGAEEYYSRAILADPGDGEILSQYAKIVWELHHEQDRASTYFERAVQASPEDSHVQAAYAGFLWETEEDEGECDVPNDLNSLPLQFQGTVASARV